MDLLRLRYGGRIDDEKRTRPSFLALLSRQCRRIPGRIRFGSSTVRTSPPLSPVPRMKEAHSIPLPTGRSGPKMDNDSLDN